MTRGDAHPISGSMRPFLSQRFVATECCTGETLCRALLFETLYVEIKVIKIVYLTTLVRLARAL